MAARKSKVAVGVFTDSAKAQQAVDDLVRAGFKEDQIGVIAPDTGTKKKGKARAAKKEKGSKWEEGAATGVAAGAGVGALWALAIAAGVLPGIGPVVAGGLLGSLLASAAGGAAVAGLVGALIGLGIPEEEARYYEEEFKAGRTIVTVKAGTRYQEAKDILTRHGAYDRATAPQPSAAQGVTATGTTTGAEGTVEVKEEELKVSKRPVKKGEVKVRKEVVTEHQTVDVPVEREEVVIERRPAGRKRAAGANIQAEEIRIPVKEEQVKVEKEPVVTEEVSVGKRKVKGTKRVGGTVRKEKVHVEQEGDAEVRTTTARSRKK